MTTQKQVAAILVGVLVLAISLVVVFTLLPTGGPSAPTQTPTPTASPSSSIRINLNLGEVELSGPYGFALDDGSIISPGPRIVVKVGDTIIITVINTGQLPHTFAVATEVEEGANLLFNSQIGSGSSPLAAGETGTVTFTVNQAGTFSYICQVPGHPTIFEMFGEFIVEP